MNTFAQIRHVIAKDVREARWLLAAYVAIVLVTTVQAAHVSLGATFLSGSLALFLVMVGMVVVASLVQADSPMRADAFWATRPIDPKAVFLAKLVLATVVVAGVALIGQYIAIASFDVPDREVPALLAQSGEGYALWLVSAMVIAALTRDLKSAFVAFAVLMVATLLVSAAVPNRAAIVTGGSTGWMLGALRTLPLIAGIVLFAVLYRLRDPRPRVRIGGVAIVAAVWYGVPAVVPAVAHVPEVSAAERPALDMVVHDYDKIAERHQLWLTLNAPTAPDSVRITLVEPVVVLRLKSGDSVRVALVNQAAAISWPLPPVKAGVQWLNDPRTVRWPSQLTVRLDGALRDSVAAGIATVTIEGRAVILTPRLIGALPLDQGASATHNGSRARIDKWTHGHGDGSLTMHVSTIGDAAQSSFGAFGIGANGELQAILVSDAHNEAMLLTSGSSSGGGLMLDLPGIPSSDHTVEYVWDQNGGVIEPALDEAWARGARLVLVNWIPVRSYPVRVTAALPLDSAGSPRPRR